MAIVTALTFIGTGRPIRPRTPTTINREASARAIRITTPKNVSEMQAVMVSKYQPDTLSVGRQAVAIIKSSGLSVNITA